MTVAGGKPRVTIVGVGLIGGSLAMAWKAAGVVAEVVGVTRRPDTIAEAVSVGAIDRGTLALEDGVREADIVIVATPVKSIAPIAIQLAKCLKPGAVVSDVGSTKGEVCRRIWREFGRETLFIGGHPMAGSEREGVLAADPYLFQNAPYVLVPPSGDSGDALERLAGLAKATGAHPLVMTTDEHDAVVATVSHLPHMVAAALVKAAAHRGERFANLLQLAAGGFRDTTRVASGPEDVWTDICLTNVDQIIEAIGAFETSLASFKRAVKEKDAMGLAAELKASRRVRESIPAKSKGILGAVFDVVVHVVDRPGAIHEVTGILGAVNINIIDIEILRVREGEGGTLRLGFERRDDMEEAVRLLAESGYKVRPRSG